VNFDGYDIQVLVAVAKACRPNSPKPERAWTKVFPLPGIPEFGNTLSALVRRRLLQRKSFDRLKPSPAGYALVGEWKANRRDLRARPVVYDLLTFGPRMVDWGSLASDLPEIVAEMEGR
jgi:hypothetical protein